MAFAAPMGGCLGPFPCGSGPPEPEVRKPPVRNMPSRADNRARSRTAVRRFFCQAPRQSLRVSVPDALRRRLRKHSSWIGPGDVSGAAGLRLRDERSLAREDVPGALGCLDQPAGQQEHDGYEESTEDQELKVHPAHGQRRPSRRRLPPGLLPLYPAFSPVRLPVHCYLSADSFRVRRYAAAPRFFRALRGGRSLGVPRPQNSNPTHVFSIIWGSAGTRYR